MVKFDAERFAITVAPAETSAALGGVCTHRSSQISAPTVSPGRVEANSRSVPKGTSCSPTRSVAPGATSVPGRYQRVSSNSR